MPRPPKSPDEKLEYGVTVLFNKRQYAAIERLATAERISKGEAARRLIDKGIQAQ
jgi:hypothetical protein